MHGSAFILSGKTGRSTLLPFPLHIGSGRQGQYSIALGQEQEEFSEFVLCAKYGKNLLSGLKGDVQSSAYKPYQFLQRHAKKEKAYKLAYLKTEKQADYSEKYPENTGILWTIRIFCGSMGKRYF